MAEIDDRVVAMSFEGDKFQSGADKALGTLGKLKEALGFGGASKGLSELDNQVGRFSTGHMVGEVQKATHGFSVMRTVAFVAIGDITRRLVDAGLHFAAAFTIDPLKEGFKSYETQINAVQTILANTGLKGAAGMQKVNDVLSQLQQYANKTVYSFSEMAKNIGTFTAAGVDLKTSEESIKGIANLAALSGSNSQQASTAMYQLSQAIAAGQVHLQDWNSVVNAGIGGKVFQTALVNTAQAMGTLSKSAVQTTGPMKTLTINGLAFRNSLTPKAGQKSWLSSEVLTTALSNFTGDIGKAKLASEGFSAAQIKAIQAQATVAVNAATKIKTFSQLTQALKEEVATAYGQIFRTIFGNITKATTLFSSLHTFFENAITTPLYNFNKLLEQAVKLGARSDFIQGFRNLKDDLASIITPLKEAFRDIFPPTTAKQIADFAEKFKEFTASLKIGSQTGKELRDTFKGIFAIFDIGRQVVEGLFHVLGDLFSAGRKNSGGFLAITAAIGNWLTAVDQALRKGGGLVSFFNNLGHYVGIAAHFLGLIPAAIVGIFNGFRNNEADKINQSFGSIGSAADTIKTKLAEAAQNLRRFFSGLGSDISSALKGINWNSSLSAINVGLFGGIFLLLRKFVSKFKDGLHLDFGGGLLHNISESFEGLTGALQGVQSKLKADALEKIAIAIGVLAASLLVLSTINGEDLKKSLGALAVAFGELLAALKILSKIEGGGAGLKLPVVAAGLVILSTAIAGLVASVYLLSKLNMAQLAKGLGGVGALLAEISAASIPLSANSSGMIRAGSAMVIIAGALLLLTKSVKAFGQMDLKTLGKGLGAVAVSLASIAVASKLFPKGMVLIGVGLLAISGALLLITKSVANLGALNFKTLAKGIGGIAIALTVIGDAVRAMPKTLALQAVGLDLIALSLGKIVKAIGNLGSMNLSTLGKGLISLGGALGILVLAVRGAGDSVRGALALTAISLAVSTLAKAITLLGQQSVGTLAKGLVTLAVAFGAVALAANALEPASAGLLGFGAAIALAGAGVAGFGLGIGAIVSAIGVLADLGGKGMKAFGAAIAIVAQEIPTFVTGIVNGIVAAAKGLADHGPELVDALVRILGDLLSAIVQDAPKFAVAFGAIIAAFIKVLRDNAGPIIREGVRLLEELLSGIDNNIGKVTKQVGQIVVRFLDALGQKLPEIVNSGAKALDKFLDGIANKIPQVAASATRVVVAFLAALANNLPKILAQGATTLVKFLDGIAAQLPKVLAAGANLIVKFLSGIAQHLPAILAAGGMIIGKVIVGIAHGLLNIIDQGAQAVLNLINGLTSAINTYEPQMVAAFINFGKAVAHGFGDGIGQAAASFPSLIGNVFGGFVNGVGKQLGIGSPSKVLRQIGKWTMQGFAQGIQQNGQESIDAIGAIANHMIDNTKKIFKIHSPSQVMYDIGKYVGEGFTQGLKGSTDAIKGVFQDLNDKLNTEIQSTTESIKSAQNSLKTATKATRSGYEDTISTETALLNKLVGVRSTLTQGLATQKSQLEGLANAYAKLADKLKTAQDALATAKQTESDAVKSYADSFEALPSVTTDPETQQNSTLFQYESDLSDQVDALQKYAVVLKKLRDLGLDQATYMKLLSDGPADLNLAQELLDAGLAGIDTVNQLDSSLKSSGDQLAQTAGDNLYSAGVSAAQKVVDGIQKQMDSTKKQMDTFATSILIALNLSLSSGVKVTATKVQTQGNMVGQNMVDGVAKGIGDNSGTAYKAVNNLAEGMISTLRTKLQIKSPSQVFALMGGQTVEGFALGLSNSQNKMTTAVSGLGDSAIAAMQASLNKASSVALDHINANPVITPVLDLSQVKEGAKQLGDITSPFSIAAAGATATAITNQQAKTIADAAKAQTQPVLQFSQTNNSPKALSDIEIYRQTQNQLSQAKLALAKK